MPKLKRQSHQALKAMVLSRKQSIVASKREQNGLSQHARELKLPIATVFNHKHKVYEVLPRLASKCHGAPVMYDQSCRDEFGNGYVCQKCGKVCAVV